MRIYVGIRKATAIAQTCVAKWKVFRETGFGGNKSKHKVYKNVVATGSAGPGRPAARTDSEGFFFPGAGHAYPHLDKTRLSREHSNPRPGFQRFECFKQI